MKTAVYLWLLLLASLPLTLAQTQAQDQETPPIVRDVLKAMKAMDVSDVSLQPGDIQKPANDMSLEAFAAMTIKDEVYLQGMVETLFQTKLWDNDFALRGVWWESQDRQTRVAALALLFLDTGDMIRTGVIYDQLMSFTERIPAEKDERVEEIRWAILNSDEFREVLRAKRDLVVGRAEKKEK